MTIIINCDDFERRPSYEVEDYDTEEELKARIIQLDKIMSEDKFSFYRSYRIVKEYDGIL